MNSALIHHFEKQLLGSRSTPTVINWSASSPWVIYWRFRENWWVKDAFCAHYHLKILYFPYKQSL